MQGTRVVRYNFLFLFIESTTTHEKTDQGIKTLAKVELKLTTFVVPVDVSILARRHLC
jgi:hypothetical protein